MFITSIDILQILEVTLNTVCTYVGINSIRNFL